MANPQKIINASLAAHSANIAVSVATEQFRTSLKGVIKIDTQLPESKQMAIQTLVDCPISFTGARPVTHDHPVLYAFREMARTTLERSHHLMTIKRRALIIGATQNEVRIYNSNPAIHYYFHMSDSKDVTRIIPDVLEDLLVMLQKKAAKNNKRVFSLEVNGVEPPSAVKRYNSVKQLYDDYRLLGNKPANFHFETVEAALLVFRDSMYDISPQQLIEYFEKTGAVEGVGYMMLPLEFYYPDMPENDFYSVKKFGSKYTLTFRYGQNNGYCHDANTWKEFGMRNVINGRNFDLVVEITDRFGPMINFRIIKVSKATNIVRMIELPKQFDYVQLLDIWDSVDLKTGKVIRPLKYFSVYANEYYDTLLWFLSLAKDARAFEIMLTYVRRRKDGVNLHTKELVAPWHLPNSKVVQFVTAVYVQSKILTEKTDLILENICPTSTTERLKNFFRKIGKAMLTVTGLNLIIELLFSEHLVGKIVRYPDSRIEQTYQVDLDNFKPNVMPVPVPIFPEGKDESGLPACPVCMLWYGKLGDQKVECLHKDVTSVFSMTDDEVKELWSELAEDDNDPAGLKAVKENAKRNLPKTGFVHSVKVYYIKGHAGVGKSHIARLIANNKDLIYAPFTKLMKDYTGLTSEEGEKYDLLFKSTHRGIGIFGADRVLVDEFSSLDFRLLMCTAYLNGTSEVFILGDEEQSCVDEPKEGWYIGNHFDLDKISTHILHVNHRNPQDSVALQNHYFGTEVESRNSIVQSYFVKTIEEFDEMMDADKKPILKMGFSHATCAKFGFENSTIRSNQGASTPDVALYVTNLDHSLVNVRALQYVGLTRHSRSCYIVHDGSPLAEQFLSKFQHFQFSEEFIKDNQYEYVDDDVKAEADDIVIRKIINDTTVQEANDYNLKVNLDVISSEVKSVSPGELIVPEEPKVVEPMVTEEPIKRISIEPPTEFQVAHGKIIARFNGFHLAKHNFFCNHKGFVPIDNGIAPKTINFFSDFPAFKRFLKGLALELSNTVIKEFSIGFIISNQIYLSYYVFENLDASSVSSDSGIDSDIESSEEYPLPEINTCLIDALASAMGEDRSNVWETMKAAKDSSSLEELYQRMMQSGGGLNVLDLSDYANYTGKQIRVDTDSLDWGEVNKIFGPITADTYYQIAWEPGHWFNPGSSPNQHWSRLSLPVGAGLLASTRDDSDFGGKKCSSLLSDSQSLANSTVYMPVEHLNNFSAMFSDHINIFTGPVLEPLKAVKVPDEVPLKENYENAPRDSYLLLQSLFPESDPFSLWPAMNTLPSQLVFDNFKSGSMNPDLIYDINPKRRPRKQHGFYAYGATKSLYYETVNQMQTLQVISERYSNKNIKPFVYNINAEIVARDIAEKFCEDCFIPDLKLDFAEMEAIMLEAENAMRIKHYESQVKDADPDARTVRFHLKNIAKPKVEGFPDVFKAGQGISAWSKTAQSAFGKGMRILNARFQSALKSNIIYDNRMTEQELRDKVNQALRRIHKLARRGVTDGTAFDSVQNRFTQEIEKTVLRKLGASDAFLDHYYSYRSDYIIQSSYVRVKCGFEKTSGEPGTLLLNTILSMVLAYYIFKGDGEFVIVGKGDDGFRAQLNLSVDEDHLAIINSYCQLGLKLSFDENVEFCGNVIIDGVFYPSIFRKLAKLASHRFRDYDHFCEYQIGLRDWENKVCREDMHKLCVVNAHVYGKTIAEAHANLACIRSFAHINREQFESVFKYRDHVLGHWSKNEFDVWKFVEY
jgi:hypothetical protein